MNRVETSVPQPGFVFFQQLGLAVMPALRLPLEESPDNRPIVDRLFAHYYRLFQEALDLMLAAPIPQQLMTAFDLNRAEIENEVVLGLIEPFHALNESVAFQELAEHLLYETIMAVFRRRVCPGATGGDYAAILATRRLLVRTRPASIKNLVELIARRNNWDEIIDELVDEHSLQRQLVSEQKRLRRGLSAWLITRTTDRLKRLLADSEDVPDEQLRWLAGEAQPYMFTRLWVAAQVYGFLNEYRQATLSDN